MSKKVDVGITIESRLGCVPEFEQREAAVYGHYTWSQWSELMPEDRARNIAHYRVHLAIDAHVSDAYDREMKRKSRAK